jgi:hypothetical protein
MARKNFGTFIHEHLVEPEGQQFTMGKFRFWLVAIVFLSVVNAVLTSLIFRSDDQQNYVSPIMLSVGVLVAWLCVGALHYSDSTDKRLAVGVSLLDSIALLFVVGHFSALMWVYGHQTTIQRDERRYEIAAAQFNDKASKLSTDNVEIARAQQQIERERTKQARLNTDAAFQLRKAAEAGGGAGRINSPRSPRPPVDTTGPQLATSTVTLEKPQAPEESSAHFLGRWDWLVRVMNFGELFLAAITLVYIRNRSARTNKAPEREEFSMGQGVAAGVRSPAAIPAFDSAKNDHTVWSEPDHTAAEKKATRVASEAEVEGLKKLRAVLGQIGFQYGPTHFFADAKWDRGYVWIRQRKSENGVARTVASTRAKLEILDHALKWDPDKFRAKLERVLRENGFEI